MKKFLYTSIISLSLIASFCFAQAISVTKLIDRYNLNSASIAIKVINAASRKSILTINSNKNMMPASNTKLLTAAASLISLGKNFHFKTQLFTDKYVNKNTLQNLYINFSGDPSFTSKDLYKILAKIKAIGITTIKNNIYLINNIFSSQKYPINISRSSTNFYY